MPHGMPQSRGPRKVPEAPKGGGSSNAADGNFLWIHPLHNIAKNKRFILRPENALMADIILDELTVLGVAVKVLKNL